MHVPLSACLIVRDDESTVEACLQSIRPHVDEIVVIDTGSEDGTPNIAKRYADKFEVYTGCNGPDGLIASFSDARNRSFSLASHDCAVWVDGDDVVRNPELLREIAAKNVRGGPFAAMLPYEYSHDHLGNVTCLQYRERVVYPRESFQWRNDVHEVLVGLGPHSTVRDESVTVVHRRQASTKRREPGRNLRILESMAARDGDSDARLLYYLGSELGNCGRVDEAISVLERYLSVSGWDDEGYMACLLIIGHHIGRADYAGAVRWAFKAASIKPSWSEAYFEIAKCHYYMAQRGESPRQNWNACIHFAQFGLSLPPSDTTLFVNPLERSVEIHRYLNVALNSVGRTREALASVRSALAYRPGDPHLSLNERIYDGFLLREELRAKLAEMSSRGHIPESRVDDVMSVVERGPECRPVPIPRPASGGMAISVYVGPGVEPWNPATWGVTGLGGSETAVVEVCKRLVRLGHSVTVYGHCGPDLEGVFDGVAYLDHSRYASHECDVLITSRRPRAVDAGVRARAVLCWVHDVHCGPDLTHERALMVDRFLCLTEWHKSFFLSQYPYVHPDQVIVTRNGIDLSRFADSPERNPRRAVYSSSPDRGLQSLLTMWPEVRRRVPDAELHVYYGFENWESCADQSQAAVISHVKSLLAERAADGVAYHGRVNQAELADSFLRSGVWAYPTWFSETSCITAMEAQAAGLAIVTTPVAALVETVSDRGRMVSGDWLSQDFLSEFSEALAAAMTDTAEAHRASVQEYARGHFGWDALAEEWDAMIRGVVRAVGEDVLPPYQPARKQ